MSREWKSKYEILVLNVLIMDIVISTGYSNICHLFILYWHRLLEYFLFLHIDIGIVYSNICSYYYWYRLFEYLLIVHIVGGIVYSNICYLFILLWCSLFKYLLFVHIILV